MTDTDTTYTPWHLARLAECMDPDSNESAGAQFLARVADDYRERVEDGTYDEDETPHEIADYAVPIYTHALWTTFADLGAYQEDPTELGEDGSDMTRAAGVCLYMIADRLVRALADEEPDTDDEDDDA